MIKTFLVADLIWSVISLAIYVGVMLLQRAIARRRPAPRAQAFCKHCRVCHRCVWPTRDITAICIESEYCRDCDADAHAKAAPSTRMEKRSET